MASPYALLCVSVLVLGVGQMPALAADPGSTGGELAELIVNHDLLLGYVCAQPENEILGGSRGPEPAVALHDLVRLGTPIRAAVAGNLTFDLLRRTLYSQDGAHSIWQEIVMCSTEGSVDPYMRTRPILNDPSHRGDIHGSAALGDASWAFADERLGSKVTFRMGRAVYSVSASRARRGRDIDAPQYPKEAVQALADTVFLRIARKPGIAGKPIATVPVTVNGKALLAGAPLVAGRVAAPVLEVAKQAGWQAAWDARNAQARLKPPSGAELVLTFASPTASVGEGVIPLRSALFKDGDVPVMDVEELAALMGGTVEKAEGRVSVRI